MDQIFSVNEATPADAGFLEKCARLAYEPYVKRIGREPAPMIADFPKHVENDRVQIFSIDDQKCGYAVWNISGTDLFLENIAILPTLQGTGVGQLALSHLEHTAIEEGLVAISLYTNEKMTESIGFYLSRGFVETDRRTEKGFNRIYYRKVIADR